MAHARPCQGFRNVTNTLGRWNSMELKAHCLVSRPVRTFATATDIPAATIVSQSTTTENRNESHTPGPRVLTTLYSWPALEPKRYAWYGSQHLDMPLRRDILHRAVIFEGDGTRQGTASTKWRTEIHGSNRKILPQKGTGNARAGDKKSPIRRGGGAAFGPKPRDFSTELPKKVYDIAWRTALSHRYRKGELIVLDNEPFIDDDCTPRLLHNIFVQNSWGEGHGRSLIITETDSPTFFEKMAELGHHGEAKTLDDVDVKDILQFGRVIIGSKTLATLFAAHSHDLGISMSLNMARGQAATFSGVVSGLVQYSD